MDKLYFTRPDMWNGGYYQLAIELGLPSDERLLAALQTLWSFPDLEGVYFRTDLEPDQQTRGVPLAAHIENGFGLFGIARLPNQTKAICFTHQIREDEGTDWLNLSIPMAALAECYPVGAFPFPESRDNYLDWRVALDSWFARIGQTIFDQVPFRLALIGHHVSGETHAEDVVKAGIPEKRWIGYLWSEQGNLHYLPCNEYTAPFSFS